MRLHLGSARAAEAEFPDLAEAMKPLAEAVPAELVSSVAAQASAHAFDWRLTESESTLPDEDVRFSIAVSLYLCGLHRDYVEAMNFDQLRELADAVPGVRENHVIGAALFGKPVADPSGETDADSFGAFNTKPYRHRPAPEDDKWR